MKHKPAKPDDMPALLHDEDYELGFATPRLGADNWLLSRGRHIISLAGPWAFCLDLHDEGLRQKWYAMRPSAPEQRALPYDWDPYAAEEITVPSCWQMVEAKWFYYEGSAWYAKSIDLPPLAPGQRVFLRIGAAAYEAKIFVNGAYLGCHRGASTPFAVEITDQLRASANQLMICVDNKRTLTRVPMRHIDWFNYGGLYRDVELVVTAAHIIRDLFVYLVPDGRYRTVCVEAQLEGNAQTAVFAINELGLEVALKKNSDGWAKTQIECDLQLWSPDQPKLYDVALSYGEDRYTDRIGLREVKCRGDEILLNGKPIFLRGIAVHEDDKELGKVATRADLARRFAHVKELNGNFVRLAHYAHHEDAAKMADELGLLLWEEIPVYWAIDFANHATFQDAQNQLAELIRRDRNRASVIVWSVGNENPDSDSRLEFMRALITAGRALDPSRLFAAACLVNHDELKIDDRLSASVDVIGINEYYGWYKPDFAELTAVFANSQLTKPVIITETGADGVRGAGAPARGFFSEQYMCEVYERQLQIIRDIPYIKGITPWVLYDFRAERRQNQYQRGWNRKGLIEADKTTKKKAFDVLAKFYQSFDKS